VTGSHEVNVSALLRAWSGGDNAAGDWLVELRAFGGLSIDETAHVANLSTATVEREWRTARAWLQMRLHNGS
jgi:hypothetical protein